MFSLNIVAQLKLIDFELLFQSLVFQAFAINPFTHHMIIKKYASKSYFPNQTTGPPFLNETQKQ